MSYDLDGYLMDSNDDREWNNSEWPIMPSKTCSYALIISRWPGGRVESLKNFETFDAMGHMSTSRGHID